MLRFLICFIFPIAIFGDTRGFGNCVTEDNNYQKWFFENALPKTHAYFEQLINSNFEMILPAVNSSKWDLYCRELGKIRICINESNNPDEVRDKEKALRILEKVSSIICDAEIKSAFPCLLNISQHPSQQCQTQCGQYKASILESIDLMTENATTYRDTDKIRTICQYVNCRATCRKADIISTCQSSSYEALKKLLRGIGLVAQTINSAIGETASFPNECTPEGLIRE